MVPVDYTYQSKKKYQEPFHLLVQEQLCQFPIQLSPLGHVGLPATICIYVVGLLPVNLNILFYFGPLKIMVVTPNYLCFDCITLKKWRYEDINVTECIVYMFRAMTL